MDFQRILQTNKVSSSILIFIIFLSIIHFLIRPSIVYNKDGSFKQFGIGYGTARTAISVYSGQFMYSTMKDLLNSY